MVATAATSAFFPVASISQESNAKRNNLGSTNFTPLKSLPINSGRLKVQTNAQAPPKVNGKSVSFKTQTENPNTDDTFLTTAPKTFSNQLPDWSMLLAAITTVFLAAEKQWTMIDWKPKRPEILMNPFGAGKVIEDNLVFRQDFSIRSYEIGADRTASIETVMNHLQETALNHVKEAGILGDGFGSTPEMCKKHLIWVVTRMQVAVDRYPTWGDTVRVETWVSASGKNGMRRDWLIRDVKTGEILTRASSVWVMMNKRSRRLSKIPKEVRGEIEPYFINNDPVVSEDGRKVAKLDDKTAEFIRSGLAPKWTDLDVNQHVNNVKYIGWILESVPTQILDNFEVCSMTIEYRKECGRDSVLQSLTSTSDSNVEYIANSGGIECQHLLRLMDESEVLRARTQWRPKNPDNYANIPQFSDAEL